MIEETTIARLDAIALSDSLRKRLVDFCISNNFLRDHSLESICRDIWSGKAHMGGLTSDVWVESAIPPKASKDTLQTLVDDGYMSDWLVKHLSKSKVFPTDRLLYSHQAQSIKACFPEEDDRPAVILTAGTGAGKTESFLFPILSELAETERRPGEGCRAIILYPMNALVNDQVERLYGWLRGQSKLTLCHFTGETPEDSRTAARANYPDFEACRHRTRRRARGLENAQGHKLNVWERGAPPDVLITNYSMLEYMLCRPQDQVFFGQDLRAVVLDEAHLYTGTLAAEITLLLRRLYNKCGVNPDKVLQFATSATLGTGATTELRTFAATLFSKPEERVSVIVGEQADSTLPEPAGGGNHRPPCDLERGFQQKTVVQTQEGKEDLLHCATTCDQLVPLLSEFVDESLVLKERGECEDYPARLLRVLRYSPALNAIEETLRNENKRQVSLEELAGMVWGASDEQSCRATSVLLGLASAARESMETTPLLPHRLHLMLRPAEGLHVCLNPSCCGPEERRLTPLGTVSAQQKEKCPDCGHKSLAIYRCQECGEFCLAAVQTTGYLLPPSLLAKSTTFFQVDSESPTTLDTLRGCFGVGPIGVKQLEECPNCKENLELMRPLDCGSSLVLSILAETLLAALPPLPTQDERSSTILPARGRRLLAFSDSRAEAARLGPRLRRQHDYQLIRAAIVRLFLSQPRVDAELLAEIDAEIEQHRRYLQNPPSEQGRERRERQLSSALTERANLIAGGTVAHWSSLLAQTQAKVLDEILDEDLGERHQPDWTQTDWERNGQASRARAQEFLANEMVRLRKRHQISVETIGVVEVVYPDLARLAPPVEFLGALPTNQLRDSLRSVWESLLATACDWLRENGAATLGTWDLDQAWQQDRVPIGRWMTRLEFVGKTDRGLRRVFARNILQRAGAEEAQVEPLSQDLLGALFSCLHAFAEDEKEPGLGANAETLPWLRKSVRVLEGVSADGLRLIFPSLALRRPQQHFLCSRTGHVWPRQALGCAPARGSNGTLRPVSEEELDQSPFVGRARREYGSDSLVFKLGLWAEEHSAQLSSSETRRLQELFQKGARNILSATTTLELGIDIGGLSGAFLSNVPPGKANYLQRAGRVGRRADGSSVVVTCARSRPYDREVFQRIGDFLARPLRQPRVFLERERIVRRHFHAWLMGSFFEQLYAPETNVGAMQAFGRMGNFCSMPVVDAWKGQGRKPNLGEPKPIIEGDLEVPKWWTPSAPDGLVTQYKRWIRYAAQQDLEEVLNELFVGSPLQTPENRADLFVRAEEMFEASLKDWLKDYESLLESWRQAEEKPQANAIRYQLNTLFNLTVIETLASARYLPRYGFPIGVQKLRVYVPKEEDEKRPSSKRYREEDQYRLERSSLLALREYVPGSQLLVGGKLVTSRGIAKHWSGENVDSGLGLRGKAAVCKNDHFLYWISEKPERCPICEEAVLGQGMDLVFPRHGFLSAAWDPPKRSVDTDRVGVVVSATTAFATKAREDQAEALEFPTFAGVPQLYASYREEGEMMVYNNGNHKLGFAICTACGYADSEDEKNRGGGLSPTFLAHAPLTAVHTYASCRQLNNNPTVLRHQVLCAREPTDIAMIDPSAYARGGDARSVVASLSVALKLAGARHLQLDSRELGCLVVPAGARGTGWGAVVYDTVPGGAGHCLELLQMGREWLEETRDFLRGTPEHHQTCEHACLDCLMTFDAQNLLQSENITLDRRTALDLLDRMLTEVAAEVALEETPEPTVLGGLPVLGLEDLKGSIPARFALRMPTAAVEKVAARGAWCEFRRPEADEEIPPNQVVIATHPKIKDPELGDLTIRSLRSQMQMDADGVPNRRILKLKSRSQDRGRFEPFSIELRGEEKDAWLPLAVLEGVIGDGDSPP